MTLKTLEIMTRLMKLLQMWFCKHHWRSVRNSPWYFHEQCQKCNAERGFGNFRIKHD